MTASLSLSHALSAVQISFHRNWDFVLALVLWSYIISARIRIGDPSAQQDLILFWLLEWSVVAVCSESWTRIEGLVLITTIHAISIGLCLCVWRLRSQQKAQVTNVAHGQSCPQPWTKPLIFPSRTTHSRLFPKKHSFSYSYLLVGVPVGWQGTIGSSLSIDTTDRRGWLHVDAADYLQRSMSNLSLREKLDKYLESQNARPSEFPNAYLVTAPRVLGYSFNPASFWYLYSEEHELRAMIVEVNNTFDERRLYFLRADSCGESISKSTFTKSWAKDFHVSPFNSREGSYSLVALDPEPLGKAETGKVSNTITLSSSGNHSKIVARIFSTGAPIDPESLGSTGILRLLLQHGWTGYFTFPRILNEARKLFFRHGLPVWYRPEVNLESISRRSASEERVFEDYFRRYIRHLVAEHKSPLRLIYRPTLGMDEYVFTSNETDNKEGRATTVEVLSPAFFTRFVHYAHVNEALDGEFLCTDSRNQTIFISEPNVLHELFAKENRMQQNAKDSKEGSNVTILNRVRWEILRILRCRPAQASYLPESAGGDGKFERDDIRTLPLSPLDEFALRHCHDGWIYRRQACLVFIAQRLFLGFTSIAIAIDVAVRVTVAAGGWWLSTPLFSHKAHSAEGRAASRVLGQVLLLNSLHVLSWIKGL